MPKTYILTIIQFINIFVIYSDFNNYGWYQKNVRQRQLVEFHIDVLYFMTHIV